MANDVVLSAALRNNLLSLQNTQSLIDTVQLRLATGLKVNSALDGPSQFFTSQSLNNRAGDLSRLLDGINLSVRSIQEANNGVTSLTTLIQQAQSIAQDAKSAALSSQGFASIRSSKDLSAVTSLVTSSNGAIVNGDDIKITVRRVSAGTTLTSADINIATSDTIYNIAGYINADATVNAYVKAEVDSTGHLVITSKEEGNLIRVTDGTTSTGSDGIAYLGLDSFVGTEKTAATTRLGGTVVAGNVLYSNAASATSAVNGVYQASAQLGAGGGTGANFIGSWGTAGTDNLNVWLTVNGTQVQLNGATGYLDTNTIQDVIDDINTSSVSSLVRATFDTTTGKIALTFDSSVTSANLQFGTDDGASTGTVAFGFGSGVLGYTGSSLTVAAAATSLYSENYTFGGTAKSLAQYTTDFNTVRSQIDALVEDANFQGVNLLGGDNLTTFFNEDRSNYLTTSGKDFTALGLGLTAANFSNSTDAQTAINQTLTALTSVRSFGQSIANSLSIIQTRADFTQQTINTLKAGAGDLVNADQNEEGANLLALQTRQQLGVTALSLAAQSQQSVLRLF